MKILAAFTEDDQFWFRILRMFSLQSYLVALGLGNFASSHWLWSIIVPSIVLCLLQWSCSNLGHFLLFVCVSLQLSPVDLFQFLGIYQCFRHLYLLSGQHYHPSTVGKWSGLAQTCSWKFLEIMRLRALVLNKINLHNPPFEHCEGCNFVKLLSVSSKSISVPLQGNTCRQNQGPRDLSMVF